MRRLTADELERAPLQPIATPSEGRAQAARVVASMHSYLRDELKLSAEQHEVLEIELERALLLHARSAP